MAHERLITRETGRFAPSPTGPLHLGSLLAAVGSYLDARSRGARWLVRIEDLDVARVIPGCADQMLRTLENFGFEWDGEVLYQSTRQDAYRDAIDRLRAAGRTFECSCSRKELSASANNNEESPGYPGTCRNGPTKAGPTALRFRVGTGDLEFDDLVQGPQKFDLASCGDVIVRRRDGIASYQLAVVVDDALQGVTRVVRGADLIASTPWQIELQAALGIDQPIYGHLPLVVEPDGTKLAKSNRAIAVNTTSVTHGLITALTLLSQPTPPDPDGLVVAELWKWAISHWNPQALEGRRQVALSAVGDKH